MIIPTEMVNHHKSFQRLQKKHALEAYIDDHKLYTVQQLTIYSTCM